MLRNYIKIAFRSLIKHRTHSIINIFGLSLAFLCSVLLFLNAYFELSFDNFYTNKEKLFKVYYHSTSPTVPEENSSMPYPLVASIKKEIPLIESTTRLMHSDNGLEYNGKKLDLHVNLVDNDFLKVFAYPIEIGNKINPLSDLGNVMLTENAAKRIFGNEDPIGKTIKIAVMEEQKELIVSAIMKDLPNNSSLKFDVIAGIELSKDFTAQKNNWGMWNHDVYVKLLNPENKKSVEKERVISKST